MRNIIGKKSRRYGKIVFCAAVPGIVLASIIIAIGVFAPDGHGGKTPEKLLVEYMGLISAQEYEKMYEIVDREASGNIPWEEFKKRNASIYEGIKAENLTVTLKAYDEGRKAVSYETSLDTAAGRISFDNEAVFVEGKNGYGLAWNDSLIFPELDSEDRVRIFSERAERGEILDRKGKVLAGEGTASSVGIVPGKLKKRKQAIGKIARLLEMEPEAIRDKLSAKWVKEDSFVPIKTIPKVKELDLLAIDPDREVLREQRRQEKLLAISGVMISDIGVREYPLGEAAAHPIGYVQGVTAEDLEKHGGEGYTANSVMGKSGMEALFEKELKGRDGCRICIVDSEGEEKKELAWEPVQHGEDIRLTIDADIQTALYQKFQKDKSCSVAMNQHTGEVLALVSTPSYDNNSFIYGMSDKQWTALNDDKDKPLYNRFRQVWCPGSTFKPITAAIGLGTGVFRPEEDFGYEGLSWQKDASWGAYRITTLHAYRPVVLENALIYSDNIYFGKAALKIGARDMEKSLAALGFQEELPFEIKMSPSQYSNSGRIETEIQLADSGYGQGQILVNPLHMACLYSVFCNGGNVIKPCLRKVKEQETEYWIAEAFSEGDTDTVLRGLKKVVNNKNGTGYLAHRKDILLAGKTGTAEIKGSKGDASGTELGWFAVFTADPEEKNPILLVSMVEDVKGRGGSGYVVEKDRRILDYYFKRSRKK